MVDVSTGAVKILTPLSAHVSRWFQKTKTRTTTSLRVYLQSGASSQAKHGGAYFSAVYGSIEDPLAALGPYEDLEPPFLGGSAQPVTFVLPLTHTQLPFINGHSSRICSEAGLMYLFGDKYIRPVPEQILLQCPLRSGSSVCMCEGQNKSDRLSTATQKWGS